MSTLEALNAISEAIQAHAKLPEVERILKQMEELAEFRLLELDEANAKIAQLQAQLDDVKEDYRMSCDIIDKRNSEIAELRDRNNNLEASLSDVTRLYNDAHHTIAEQKLTIESGELTNESLRNRLADAKGYGERLAETLRSIGSKIVAAIEVPEVTPSEPFPVSNPVGLPNISVPTVVASGDTNYVEPVAEPTVSDLVKSCEDIAPGTNVYKYW